MADGDGLDRLSSRLGLDPAAIRAAVPTDAETPWYLRLAIGFGGWLTAAALLLAVAAAIVEALSEDSLPRTAAGAGAAILAGAVALHRGSQGPFAVQFAVAAALAGQMLVVGGLGTEAESLAVGAAVACAVATLLAVLLRDPELQFLSCALAVALALAALMEREVPQPGGVLLAVTLPPALVLLLSPPGGIDLRGLAWALLLVPLGTLSVPDAGGFGADWLPRTLYAAALLAVVALIWRRSDPGLRAVVAAGGAVAVLLGAAAAAGILGSLLLLALAYLLGSRMLAALGVLAHAWFVSRFYYDLELTLLEKSGMLAAAGLLLLGLWWLWVRRAGEEAGNG